MKEVNRQKLMSLYLHEIQDVEAMLVNEIGLELRCKNYEPNPHAKNVEILEEYIGELDKRLAELCY